MVNNKSYMGRGWAFPPKFTKGIGADMVSEEEDIHQSLIILFSTTQGERPMRFDYGCNIRQWVFAEMTLSEKTMMADTIEQAILYFEPRIKVLKVTIETKDMTEGILWIDLEYLVRQTNSRSNMVFPFYFMEGTNL